MSRAVYKVWVFPLFWGLMACGSWRAASNEPQTPMNSACRELPTVEECRAAAMDITNECLRGCVRLQCAGIKVNCDEYVKKECKANSSDGVSPFGFVYRTTETTCDKPVGEINWCELPGPRECRARAMVHELAHSCGWAHKQGMGVPSDDGFITCE